MAGYIGAKQGVTQVDGYNRYEADAEFVQTAGDTMTGALAVNGNLTVDTNTLFVDAANNRVGVGTSSPVGQDPSANNLVVEDAAGNGGITIKTPTSAYGSLHFSDGTGVDAYRGILAYNHSDNSMQFYTNATERMRIDTAGRVTMPYQPAFMARSNASGNTGGTGDLVFATILNNRGSHYNAANGVFTAPVAGAYQFHANLLSRSGGQIGLSFKVNGVSVVFIEHTATTGSQFAHCSGSVVFNLNANDTVNINSVFFTYGNVYDWFAGYLIG